MIMEEFIMSESTKHFLKELSLLVLSVGSAFTAFCAAKKLGDLQNDNEEYGLPTFDTQPTDTCE